MIAIETPTSATVTAMPKRRAHHIRTAQRETELPLFDWVQPAYLKRSGRPRTGTAPAKRCRSCGVQISRYSRGHCRTCGYVGLKRCCPDDFLSVLKRLGSQGAAKHYHASLGTVTRWRRELDLRPQARVKARGIGQARSDRGFVQRPLLVVRDMTDAGRAADFMRRFSSVHRCAENGKPDPKGAFWRRNFSVLDDDEMIARAKRLGWCEMEF